MFKFFGVSKEEEFDEIFEEEDEVENAKSEKEEIWQIAVDILETKFEIILLAPVAGISLDEIDISFHNNVYNHHLLISFYFHKSILKSIL